MVGGLFSVLFAGPAWGLLGACGQMLSLLPPPLPAAGVEKARPAAGAEKPNGFRPRAGQRKARPAAGAENAQWALSILCTGPGKGDPLQKKPPEPPRNGGPGGFVSLGCRRCCRLAGSSGTSQKARKSPTGSMQKTQAPARGSIAEDPEGLNLAEAPKNHSVGSLQKAPKIPAWTARKRPQTPAPAARKTPQKSPPRQQENAPGNHRNRGRFSALQNAQKSLFVTNCNMYYKNVTILFSQRNKNRNFSDSEKPLKMAEPREKNFPV